MADQRQTDITEIPSEVATSLPDENPLSEREMEVSRLLVTGATNTEIARELVISPHTVKVHLRNVFEKLQVSSRTEASLVLLQRGWLTVPGVEVTPGAEDEDEEEERIPEPLSNLVAEPVVWQQYYFVAACVVCVLALFWPNLQNRPRLSTMLLSDVNQTVVGNPSLENMPRWQARTPLLEARSRLGMAEYGGMLYVMGGENADGKPVANLEVYDLLFNRWTTLQAMPAPRANLAVTTLGDKIYVAGGSRLDDVLGSENVILDDMIVYDPETNTWEKFRSLPYAAAGAQLVAYDSAAYFMGGWDGENMRSDVWRLHLPTDADSDDPQHWEPVGQLPTAMAYFGALTMGTEIFIAGGYDGQRELAAVYAYDIETGVWRTLSSLAAPRGGLTLVSDGLSLLVFGGGWTRNIDTHERYDVQGDQWTNFPSPIRGEWRHLAGASSEGNIYLVGGWSGAYLDTMLQYQSSFRSLLPVITND